MSFLRHKKWKMQDHKLNFSHKTNPIFEHFVQVSNCVLNATFSSIKQFTYKAFPILNLTCGVAADKMAHKSFYPTWTNKTAYAIAWRY